MKILKAIVNGIDRSERVCIILAGAGLFLMTVLTVYETVARYAFRAPVEWAVEIPSYASIWATALALAFTQKVRGHIAVGAFISRLSNKNRGRFSILLLTFYLGTIIFVTWAVFRVLQLYIVESRFSIVMKVPLFIPTLVIFIGFILLDLQVILDFTQALKAARKGTEFQMAKGD